MVPLEYAYSGCITPNAKALKHPINACFHSGAFSINNLQKDGNGSFSSSVPDSGVSRAAPNAASKELNKFTKLKAVF